VRITLTIETNDPAYAFSRLGAAALVRQAAAELEDGWGPDRDMMASGRIVGHWTYEEGVTK
jgi:hypothetical protein